MKNFYYVYILVSDENPEIHYTGFTEDLDARLKKHNSGECSHTAKHRPWHIQNAFAFRSKENALAFEKYLKSDSGREFAHRHF